MARRPTPEDQKRDGYIGIKVTRSEKAHLEALAKEAGHTLSTWAGRVLMAEAKKEKADA